MRSHAADIFYAVLRVLFSLIGLMRESTGLCLGRNAQRMALADTDAQAKQAYIAAFESTSGSERVERAVEMAGEAKAIAISGIRFRHPDLSESEVHVERLRLLYGDALTKMILHDDPV